MSSYPCLLKRLLPSLATSAIAALIGAVVGGYVTQDIVTKDTQTKLVAASYGAYMTEVARVLSIAQDGDLTRQDETRLESATAVLELTASENVFCRAVDFLMSVKEDSYPRYVRLVSAMRKELTGEEATSLNLDETCTRLWETREAEAAAPS